MALLLEQKSILPALVCVALMMYLSLQRRQDVFLLVFALPIALTFEWLATALNLLSFKEAPFPFWLVLLWSAFLLTVNTSMQFLQKLPWYLAWLLCAVFAPASYFAGARFEVLNIELPLWQFWIMYGAGWASMFLAILILNNRMLAKK